MSHCWYLPLLLAHIGCLITNSLHCDMSIIFKHLILHILMPHCLLPALSLWVPPHPWPPIALTRTKVACWDVIVGVIYCCRVSWYFVGGWCCISSAFCGSLVEPDFLPANCLLLYRLAIQYRVGRGAKVFLFLPINLHFPADRRPWTSAVRYSKSWL